jgi:hypothetical protein
MRATYSQRTKLNGNIVTRAPKWVHKTHNAQGGDYRYCAVRAESSVQFRLGCTILPA